MKRRRYSGPETAGQFKQFPGQTPTMSEASCHSDKWEHFKEGIEASWAELETAFRELKQTTKR
jgi:hypothetical protein